MTHKSGQVELPLPHTEHRTTSRDYHSSAKNARVTHLQMFSVFPWKLHKRKYVAAAMHPEGTEGGQFDLLVGRESHHSDLNEASFTKHFTLVNYY